MEAPTLGTAGMTDIFPRIVFTGLRPAHESSQVSLVFLTDHKGNTSQHAMYPASRKGQQTLGQVTGWPHLSPGSSSSCVASLVDLLYRWDGEQQRRSWDSSVTWPR